MMVPKASSVKSTLAESRSSKETVRVSASQKTRVSLPETLSQPVCV